MVEPCEYVCTAIMILKLLFLPFPCISSWDSAKESRFSEEVDESDDEDEGDQDEGAVDPIHTAGGKRLATRLTYPVRSKKLTLVARPTQPSTQPVGSAEVLKTEKSKTDV